MFVQPVFLDIFKLAGGLQILDYAFHRDQRIGVCLLSCDLIAFDAILQSDASLLQDRLGKTRRVQRVRANLDDHLARTGALDAGRDFKFCRSLDHPLFGDQLALQRGVGLNEGALGNLWIKLGQLRHSFFRRGGQLDRKRP